MLILGCFSVRLRYLTNFPCSIVSYVNVSKAWPIAASAAEDNSTATEDAATAAEDNSTATEDASTASKDVSTAAEDNSTATEAATTAEDAYADSRML